tara:strand:+ start:3250 stop:3825 length:576 start_codon:yes stop_codon:yes gene_type:complete
MLTLVMVFLVPRAQADMIRRRHPCYGEIQPGFTRVSSQRRHPSTMEQIGHRNNSALCCRRFGSVLSETISFQSRCEKQREQILVFDLTDAIIEKTRDNIAAAELTNVELQNGIIEQQPIEDESVDWAISNCVINLSPENPKVFPEIIRVLKPSGRMLVSGIVVDDFPEEITNNQRLYSSYLAGTIGKNAYL